MKQEHSCWGIYICVICCFVLLFFAPISLGNISSVHEAKPLNEVLPDLIIDDIYIGMNYEEPGPNFQDLFVAIRNIGDAPAHEINYRVVVKHMRFGIIPISTITTQYYNNNYIPGLPPGHTHVGNLPTGSPNGDGMPLFGFIRFEVTVNPDHTMAESNYNNNYYNKTFFEVNPLIFGFITWYSF